MAVEDADPKPAPSASSKSRLVGIVVVVGLMAVEGVGVFMLARAISPNSTTAAMAGGDETGIGGDSKHGEDDFVEIQMAECRPSNMMTGKFITFHIRVSALVAAEDAERAEAIVRSKRARLEDSVNTVIRSAEPKQLSEPGLESIKRRLRREFDDVLSDDEMVKAVLIPQFLQSGPGV